MSKPINKWIKSDWVFCILYFLIMIGFMTFMIFGVFFPTLNWILPQMSLEYNATRTFQAFW